MGKFKGKAKRHVFVVKMFVIAFGAVLAAVVIFALGEPFTAAKLVETAFAAFADCIAEVLGD
jgi:hypothetical protein